MMPEVDAWTHLAWNQIWQVTLVATIAGVVARCACRNRPHLAYLLGLIVIVKCWVPPILSSRGGIFCWPPRSEAANSRAELSDDQRLPEARLSDRSSSTEEMSDRSWEDGAQRTGAISAANIGEVELAPRADTITVLKLLFGVWLVGAIGLAAVTWYQAWSWRRRMCSLMLPPDSRLEILTAELAGQLGLRCPPRVTVTFSPVGPAVFGWMRPTIVLPEILISKAEHARLELVVAHEMIHIRRGDLVVGLFQSATQVVWWFHPLIWWTCRQLTRERERACDEEVLAALRCHPASYAQCLLDVLRLKRQSPLLPAFPGMRAGEVTRRRFEHILNRGRMAQRRTPLHYWLIAMAVLCIVLPGERLTIATPAPRPAASDSGARREPAAAVAERPVSPSATVTRPSEDRSPSTDAAVADDSTQQALAAADPVNVAPPSEIEQAIERGVNFLKAEQREDGSWPEVVGYPGGITGLCTLAMLKSGVKPDAPSVQTALAFLRTIRPSMTYSTSLQTMVFCAADPKAGRRKIERNVSWLANQQKQAGVMAGAWGYPQAEGDNSNTGFAMLALYEAELVGVKTNPAVWRRALDYWVTHQNSNGSWGYKPETGGTGSMTSQGLFCVAAASKVLGEEKPDDPGPKAIEKAVEWLGANFSGMNNPGSRGPQWRYYYLHALGHAGRTAGKEKFGDHDWFAEGAPALLCEQHADGYWRGKGHAEDDPHLATSLALLFLLQGRPR